MSLSPATRRLWCASDWPLYVCVLGGFRLLSGGQPMAGVSGSKMEALLALLARRRCARVPRDVLLAALWPDADPPLARQSLNSLIYGLRKHLGDALGGASPIDYADGSYGLNCTAGVGIDLAGYEALIATGDRQRRAGDLAASMASYTKALRLYRGDLWSDGDLHAAMERERVRASYLTLLGRVADFAYIQQDYDACLDYCSRLLLSDPFREDAHRLVMRCYVRVGARAQALRQYRVCADLLRSEFDAAPEPATVALYEQVRLDPVTI